MHYSFNSFGRVESGRVVTASNGMVVCYCRNPYGSHNLVMIEEDSNAAIGHGNIAVVIAAKGWLTDQAYRKVRKFLAKRGVGRNWSVVLDEVLDIQPIN